MNMALISIHPSLAVCFFMLVFSITRYYYAGRACNGEKYYRQFRNFNIITAIILVIATIAVFIRKDLWLSQFLIF
jgi:uncharacterized membrane protein YidH (DUF202 family)